MPFVASDPQSSSRTELEGTWHGIQSSSGDKVRTFKPGEVQMVFKGAVLLGKGIVSATEQELTFTAVHSTSPKQLDYALSGKPPTKCIYELSGDTLRIACAYGDQRPTSFASTGRAGILTLKRQRE